MNEAFLRNYRKILTTVLILLPISLTIACFYDRPLGDELFQSLDAARAWRGNDSLLRTFQEVFQMMVQDYQTRSGIFFSMLLHASFRSRRERTGGSQCPFDNSSDSLRLLVGGRVSAQPVPRRFAGLAE